MARQGQSAGVPAHYASEPLTALAIRGVNFNGTGFRMDARKSVREGPVAGWKLDVVNNNREYFRVLDGELEAV
jgi:hypothetical protein